MHDRSDRTPDSELEAIMKTAKPWAWLMLATVIAPLHLAATNAPPVVTNGTITFTGDHQHGF